MKFDFYFATKTPIRHVSKKLFLTNYPWYKLAIVQKKDFSEQAHN
jgi:hypothetical protein